MAETAGLMLLRAGLLTQEQLAQANQSKRQLGGTLGGHLVALGLLDEEKLADFYRHRLMVPKIGRDALAAITAKVIAVVPQDMAAEFRVVPVSVDREGNLTLAMADPSDTHAVDEVGFFTGHFVMRAVTTESTIAWALDKYYGIATPEIPSAAAPAPEAAASSPPPPVAATTTGDGTTAAVAAAVAGAASAVVTTAASDDDDYAEVVLLTEPKASSPEVVVEPVRPEEAPPAPVLLEHPTAAGAEATPAPPTPPADEGTPLVQVELSVSGRVASATAVDAPADSPAAQALTAAIRALREAADPDGVAGALLDYVGSFSARAAFFTVRKGRLRCDHHRGEETTAALRDYDAALDEPSAFRDVLATRLPYRGGLGDSEAVRALLPGMPGPRTEDAVLVPVAVRHRVVAFVLGDRFTAEPSEAGMTRVALEAGIAYERLIATRKETAAKAEA